MKGTFLRTSLVSLVALLPLAPLAHAQVAGTLYGGAGLGLGTSAGVSADASASASGDLTPIVVTHADAASASTTSAALRTHASLVARGDANVASVSLSPRRVELRYEEPAKLFGFIDIRVPVSVSVSATGSTTVAYPWYSFLCATGQAALAARAQAAAHDAIGANAAGTLSASAQAHLLDSLHAALASEASASSSASASK